MGTLEAGIAISSRYMGANENFVPIASIGLHTIRSVGGSEAAPERVRRRHSDFHGPGGAASGS
jgi:hypothetical protein